MSKIELEDGENIVAELVPPSDYQKHLDQVACVTDRRLVFLRKKRFGVVLPYEIEYVPISECQQISYSISLAIFQALFGGLLMVISLLVIFGTVMAFLSGDNWKKLFWLSMASSPLLFTGGVMVSGLKRHKLLFQCGERPLLWVSSAGHGLQHWLPSLNAIFDSARTKNIPTAGFPFFG